MDEDDNGKLYTTMQSFTASPRGIHLYALIVSNLSHLVCPVIRNLCHHFIEARVAFIVNGEYNYLESDSPYIIWTIAFKIIVFHWWMNSPILYIYMGPYQQMWTRLFKYLRLVHSQYTCMYQLLSRMQDMIPIKLTLYNYDTYELNIIILIYLSHISRWINVYT